MSLMEMFANPELFDQLSLGDKLAGAGVTTLMGMGITFLVLLLIWGSIAVMSRVIKLGEKKKETPASTGTPMSTPSVAPVAAAPVDNGELIAVITAAIAAMEGAGSGAVSNFVVKKISRITGESTAWSKAGTNECFDSRRR